MTGTTAAEETLDSLGAGGLLFPQAREGYRFSLDPLLLCDFVAASGGRGIDLGCGCGIMPQLLARAGKGREWLGVERQAALLERARRSVALNGLEERVRVVAGDIRELAAVCLPGSFDLAVSNPPYRPAGQGRVAPDAERGAARHELAGGLADFVAAAAVALDNGGRFYLVHLAERLAEILAELRSRRLEPKRLRLVHPRAGQAARLVLVEGRKHGRPGLTVEPPLLVYGQGPGRDYSPALQRMFAGLEGLGREG